MVSQKSVTVFGMHVAEWIYDCENLISIISLDEDPPYFDFSVKFSPTASLGKIAKNILTKMGDAALKDIAKNIDDWMPEFSGSVHLVLKAKPVKEICHDELDPKSGSKTGKKVQTVGYDWIFDVTVKGKYKVAGTTIEVSSHLPFTGTGERVDCECNENIDPKKLYAAIQSIKSAEHILLSINGPVENTGYGLTSPIAGGIAAAMISKSKMGLVPMINEEINNACEECKG